MDIGLDILLLFGVLVLITWLMTYKPHKFPPGPPKWPIFGNAKLMKSEKQIYLVMRKVRKLYGDVVGFHVFNRPMVLISGVDAIREVCSRDDMSGRPEHTFQKILNNGKIYGVASTSGEVWKVQRRFALQHLRDLGFGKRSLEGVTHEEIQAVFEVIDDLSGGPREGFPNPVDLHEILAGAGINVLWHIMAGKRYSHRDPEFKKLITAVQKLLQASAPGGGILLAFPSLGKIFPRFTGVEAYVSSHKPLNIFLEAEIKSHKESIDYEHPRDFMDIYLAEIERQKDDPDTSFTEMQLQRLCAELYVAGTDTTLNTLSFGFLYMILYPDVQKKVQNEIDEVVGKDRLPSLEDRSKLPYVDATIQEVLRLSSIASSGLPHAPLMTNDYINFRGYHIPKGATIILNQFDLHHDPNIWDEPEKLVPERFLEKSTKARNHEALIPFGAGKRACLGESLARNNVFLFFTAILQRYTLRVPDGQPKPLQEPAGRSLLIPWPFKVKVNLRN